MDSTEAVQATNDDASECKRCAVELKYWDDKFIQYFVRHYDKKAPEINRGYFARVSGVNSTVEAFLEVLTSKQPNAISLLFQFSVYDATNVV